MLFRSIGDKRKHNPVVLALANGHMSLARYLYLKARPGYLKPENGDHGAALLTEAICNRDLGKNSSPLDYVPISCCFL